jgi:hypothetical protein
MLRTALGTGSRIENRLLRDTRCGVDFGDQRNPASQSACLVEKDGIQMPHRFQINSPIDNGALSRGAANRTEDGKRSARRDATRSSHNDNQYRRPDVLCAEKGEHRRAQREVDQIAGKPVCRLLDGCARMLRRFDRFNNLAEGGFLAQALGDDLKSAGLVDGASIDAAGCLFAGHRLACNRCLLHKRVPTEDLAIDWNPAAGTDQDNLSREDRIRSHFESLTVSKHAGRLRKKIEHVLNGTPPAAYSQSFEDFGSQHERGDEQGGKELR